MEKPAIIFVNGKSECGCIMEYSNGHGEYSDVHRIILCGKHHIDMSECHEVDLNLRYTVQRKKNDEYKNIVSTESLDEANIMLSNLSDYHKHNKYRIVRNKTFNQTIIVKE